MRVTNKMLSNNFLSDMQINLNNMKILQQQMSSGKEIRKPSDDPFKVSRTMQLNTDINTNKQYNENIKDTINWLSTTDTAIGQAENSLQRVKELLTQAGNAGYSVSERKAIKDEINQRISELSQIMNTNFDGKYIFGGTRSTAKPMDTKTVYTLPASVTQSNEKGGAAAVSGTFSTQPDKNHTYMVKVTGVNPLTPGEASKVQLSVDGGAYGADINVASGKFALGSDAFNLNFEVGTNTANKSGDVYTFTLNSNTKLDYDFDKDAHPADSLKQVQTKLVTEISQGVTMEYNVSASDMLEYKSGSETKNLKDLLSNIVNHLDGMKADGSAADSDAVNKLTNEDMGEMKDAIDSLLTLRSEVGAKQNRMESAQSKNTDENYNMTDVLSKTEDIDITQKTMEYATMQTVYLASLQTSSKVLQPSLMDYLR